MKINTIKIKNFRGIPDMEISLERISFFTGPCGAGKTSVLKAFNFALTGDVKKDDIREQSDRASATIVFEDQSSIQRICKLSAATQVKVNGKNSTAKAADEFLQAKLGTSTDIFQAMCKTDFFEVLSQKEQTEFFLSILPTKISFEKLCEFIGENNKKLTEEEKTTLKTAFANISDPFGLDEIDMAYKYFYQKRKEKKAFVENLKPRAVFDMSILPEESKENLQKSLEDVIRKETLAKEYQKNLNEYNRQVKMKADSDVRLKKLKEEYQKYSSVEKPDPDYKEKQESEKKQFENAIHNCQTAISTIKGNLELLEKTLKSLNTNVCPISSRLICTSDRTPLKSEFEDQIQKSNEGIKKNTDFIKRCEKEVQIRTERLDAYQKQQISYNNKKNLHDQIQNYVPITVMEKPEEVKAPDMMVKQEIQSKISKYTSFENAKKAKCELEEEQKKLRILENLVLYLDSKTGVRGYILKKVVEPFTKMCNQKASKFHNMELKISFDNGIEFYGKTENSNGWKRKVPGMSCRLYSLQGLQMDANKVYGFSLQHTLDLAQSLYEKGFTTYPRTDSSHLTDDMGPEMKKVIQMLFSSDIYSKFKSHATEPVDSSNKYYFDSSKVESHYAIVPTSKKLSLGQMSDDEKKLYDMIARSVICICYPKAQLSKTNIITEKSGEEFTTCGISILKPGYFEVLGRPRENLLPKLQERESVQGKYIKEAKKTEPPKRYTDQTLLTAMITCGKHIDDAELRKVMSSGADGKPRGLGRPSTQASIVTTLETRRYLERKGKSLIPTERGIHLISIFPIEDLKAPVMTAQWEKRLDDIEKGTDDYTSFITDLENSVRKWTKMIMELKSDDAEFQSNSSNYKCPICGRALLNFPWGYGCSGYQDDKCKFNIPRKIASKTLTEKQIQNLIQKGDSGYISGFVKNGGKTFGARIVIDKEEKKLKFADDVHGELLCPLCGKPLRKMAWGYGCSGYRETRCNFAIGTVAKKKLTDHQIKALLAGESVMVKGMKGKNGSFDAEVRLCNAGENKGKLQFIQN